MGNLSLPNPQAPRRCGEGGGSQRKERGGGTEERRIEGGGGYSRGLSLLLEEASAQIRNF